MKQLRDVPAGDRFTLDGEPHVVSQGFSPTKATVQVVRQRDMKVLDLLPSTEVEPFAAPWGSGPKPESRRVKGLPKE